MRVAVLGSGQGSNLKALLGAIRAGAVQATVTLALSDKPESRFLEIAKAGCVPAVVSLPRSKGETKDAYNQRILEILQEEAPDLVVLAGFMRILPAATIAPFAGRIINIHPSLLPAFPGPTGVKDACAAGAGIVGCTTHIVTAELDGGPILLQAALSRNVQDSVPDTQARVLALEHLILPRTVQLFAEGAIHPAATPPVKSGTSWLQQPPLPLVSGALYSEGF